MNREEFNRILKACGVPVKVFDAWWGGWIKYTAMFKLECQQSSLESFARNNVEKGCFENAPW